MLRFSAGRIEEDGTQDFYWDTQFETREEAEEWGINHDCTHIYDTVTGTFESIF